MHAQNGLFSFEIDEPLCRFARAWLERGRPQLRRSKWSCGVRSIQFHRLARDYLGGAPELIFLDSSHEYKQTLDELDAGTRFLAPGGLIVLHDTSEFAASFDVTQQGGVHRALGEWREAHSPRSR